MRFLTYVIVQQFCISIVFAAGIPGRPGRPPSHQLPSQKRKRLNFGDKDTSTLEKLSQICGVSEDEARALCSCVNENVVNRTVRIKKRRRIVKSFTRRLTNSARKSKESHTPSHFKGKEQRFGDKRKIEEGWSRVLFDTSKDSKGEFEIRSQCESSHSQGLTSFQAFNKAQELIKIKHLWLIQETTAALANSIESTESQLDSKEDAEPPISFVQRVFTDPRLSEMALSMHVLHRGHRIPAGAGGDNSSKNNFPQSKFSNTSQSLAGSKVDTHRINEIEFTKVCKANKLYYHHRFVECGILKVNELHQEYYSIGGVNLRGEYKVLFPISWEISVRDISGNVVKDKDGKDLRSVEDGNRHIYDFLTGGMASDGAWNLNPITAANHIGSCTSLYKLLDPSHSCIGEYYVGP